MIDKLTSPSEVVGRRVRRGIGVLACTFITSTGGALIMNNYGQTETTIGPTVTDVGLQISGDPREALGLSGGTDIGLGDMGAHFDTHPVGPSLNGSIVSIDFEGIKKAVGPTVTTGQLDKTMQRQVASDIDRLKEQRVEIVARSLGAFGIGALGTGLMLGGIIWASQPQSRMKMREYLRSNAVYGMAGALTIGIGGAAAAGMTFTPSQFTAPEKSGAVASAEVLAKSSDRVRIADERSANNAVAVLSFINSIEAEAKREEGIKEPAFQIVIVGDNHMISPVSLISGELRQTEIPSVVFDGGDYTDFGTSSENNIIRQWYMQMEEFTKYSVPGNHDTADSVNALRDTPNTTVVDKGQLMSLNVNGLRVLAIGDPLYTPEHAPELTEEQADAISALRTLIVERIEQATEREEPYDIIFTHDSNILDDVDLAGANVIYAHTHHQEISFEDGSWRVNPGTTGGAGLRRFQGVTQDTDNDTVPRSYTVLSFDSSCQLIEAKETSYDSTGSDDEYGLKKIANPDYDPELDSTRCLT